MGLFAFITLGSLAQLPSSEGIIHTVLFSGTTFWLYKRIGKLKAEINEEEAEKFSGLGMMHGDYQQIYQEDLDKYIQIQSNLTNDDDYDKLKITNVVNKENDRGYFQFDVPYCRIYWLESTYDNKKELMALLLNIEHFEDMDEVGGIMTFLYPAIHALYTKSKLDSRSDTDELISKIVKFISDKSVEQIQSLQAKSETLTESITKIDQNEFHTGTLNYRIFDVELKIYYDVAYDEVKTSFSILIVEEDTRQKFSVTREKVLGTV